MTRTIKEVQKQSAHYFRTWLEPTLRYAEFLEVENRVYPEFRLVKRTRIWSQLSKGLSSLVSTAAIYQIVELGVSRASFKTWDRGLPARKSANGLLKFSGFKMLSNILDNSTFRLLILINPRF